VIFRFFAVPVLPLVWIHGVPFLLFYVLSQLGLVDSWELLLNQRTCIPFGFYLDELNQSQLLLIRKHGTYIRGILVFLFLFIFAR